VSRFHTLLVPTDFSDHSAAALDTAIELGRALGAELLLLHVFQRPIVMFEPYGIQPLEPVLTEVPEAARRRLDVELRAALGAGADARAIVVEGAAVEKILEEAAGADLVVMGTHGLTGLPHVLLGSVAERTVRLAPCPVLTVKAARPD
jgi:nucleotide-binding universal stress UspA family protein